jgi:hypothetical protein
VLSDIEAPSLKGMIINVAVGLLFYVSGHGFLFESSSIGNPQYASEVWHQTPGTPCIIVQRFIMYTRITLDMNVVKN